MEEDFYPIETRLLQNILVVGTANHSTIGTDNIKGCTGTSVLLYETSYDQHSFPYETSGLIIFKWGK